MKCIDINCDMGEEKGNDKDIIKYISSANIACGGHAGSVETIKKTMELAHVNNVKTGAHPGYIDKENFGRIETGINNSEICKIINEQVFLFIQIAKKSGTSISHIKLHGALYNRAATDYQLMYDIVKSIHKNFGVIPFYTLSGSISIKAVLDCGGICLREAFSDRAYTDIGTLVSRKVAGSVIQDSSKIANRVLQIINKGSLDSISGKLIKIEADTICVHGDSPDALKSATCIYNLLLENNIFVRRSNEI